MGGSRYLFPGTRIAKPVPLAPPLPGSSTGFRNHSRSLDLSLREFPCYPSLFLFDSSRRSGPGLTGYGSIPYGAGIPDPPHGLLSPVEKAPLCRRSPLRPLRGHGVVVLLFTRQPASLLPVWTWRGSVFFKTPMAAVADFRTLLRSVRDLPPSAS